MKKIIILIFLLPLMSFGQCFSKGSQILSFGYGLGRYQYNYSMYSGYSRNIFGPFLISYEKSMHEGTFLGKNINLGDYTGYIGFGGSLSAYSYHMKWNNSYKNDYRINSLAFMLRGAYHTNFGVPELDVYAGLGAGIGFYSYRNNTVDPTWSNSRSIGMVGQFFLGGRYFLTEKLGVFGEFGMGYSYGTIGLSLKLN